MFKGFFKRRLFYGLLAIVTAFGLWAGTPQAGHAISWLELLLRGAQIFQLSNLGARQEVALGQQINAQLTQQLAQNGSPVIPGGPIANYINQVGQSLVPSSARPDIPYTFQVVADPNVNAFATMGGFVYVNAGLMLVAENEAELAGVMAHEIGHIAGRHAIKQMRDRAIADGVLSAAGLNQSQAVQIGVELALSRPNSRQDELEADKAGLGNLRAAGYAPTAMVTFMQKLQQRGGQGVPTFLSTHPATGDRIALLQKELQANPPAPNETAGLDSQGYRGLMRSFLR